MHPENCPFCGGGFEAKTITYQQSWGEELFEFEDVPAWVCGQCGERWLEAEVAQRIEDLIRSNPKPKRYHQVPVFSLAE